jgi:hypothetical protein
MKHLIYLAAIGLLTQPCLAAQPDKINFAYKVAPLLGGPSYRIYIVRCSDGTKKELTSWDKTKKWCIGKESEKSCSDSQMKAATTACK